MFVYCTCSFTSLPPLPPLERAAVIQAAVTEAKASAKLKEEAAKAASAQADKDGKYTSGQLLSKFFKRPSETAKKIGKAQLLYEDMVRKAERKLSENHRKSHAATQTSRERAQELAKEIFHRPGTLLTSQEIARMWQESGCVDARPVPTCNFATINEFRTCDGTCNNLDSPLLGAATTEFTRLVPPFYEDGISSLRGELQARESEFMTLDAFVGPNPSPRIISDTIIDNVTQNEIPFTHILMQWGQFLDHDLDFAPELEAECEGCEFTDICIPVRVADRDEEFGVGTDQDADCLPFRRSVAACDMSRPGSFTPRENINDITSYIDASMVYGSNAATAAAVRLFSNGLLRTGSDGRSLPIDDRGIVACPNRQDCFLCGDVRCNEQISLSIMHTIWLREHNRIAGQLGNINPQWDDERIYQEARKIVGAMIQKITYIDYLPKILGPTGFNFFIGPYFGYDDTVDAGVPNSFAAAAYRYGHSLIRPQFDRLGSDFRPLDIGPLNLRDAFFRPDQFTLSRGTDPILRGLVSVNSRRVDEFLNDVLTSQLFQTGTSPGLDLATLNIQRGRDHGLPPYLIFKNFCNRIFNITSDFENELTLVRFLQVYGSLETVDLWIAGLAEGRLPDSLLGATFSCIFGITFANSRSGDRFWFQNPGVFTPSQLGEINDASLSRVICDNADDIDRIQPDAFLSNQSRVPCNNLRRVDLRAWREDACYFRASILARNFDVIISVFSRAEEPAFVFTSSQVAGSSTTQFSCVPILCPTSATPLDLIVFSTAEFIDTLTISPNSLLPPSSLPRSGSYRGSVPLSSFQTQTAGVFLDLASCQASRQISFTFRFPTLESAEAELLSLVKLAAKSQDDEKENMQPVVKPKLPESIIDAISEKNPSASLAVVASSNEESQVAAATDESLLHELEDALKALKN